MATWMLPGDFVARSSVSSIPTIIYLEDAGHDRMEKKTFIKSDRQQGAQRTSSYRCRFLSVVPFESSVTKDDVQ